MNNMEDLIIELETIRNYLFGFSVSTSGKSNKDLAIELTAVIEKFKVYNKEEKIIPEILAPEDLPDDEDL